MKKRMGLILSALLLLAAGCGGKDGEGEAAEVSLADVYAGMEEACGWDSDFMADVEGELLEEYYPGLSGISMRQLIVKVPAMSSDVNEIVLLQCEPEQNVEDAAAILQARIDSQVESGAWYPETLEAWQNAKVLRQGKTYAALIASGEFQSDLETEFLGAFS